MVEDFTSLQLSHEEDRLPAFSGLARQYRNLLKSEYLAGLWRENLAADLLWFAPGLELGDAALLPLDDGECQDPEEQVCDEKE